VRVIRNRDRQGIGIAYVAGADKQTLANIRALDGCEFEGRPLRIKKAVPKKRLEKKEEWRNTKHQQYLELKENNKIKKRQNWAEDQ
jgi:hypothetical protein